MNKDKAIQLLGRLQDPEPYEPMLTKDAYDAIQMAIDALSADGDTISRKAAVEVIDDELDKIDHVPQWVFDRLINRLRELPPAQPERIKGHWVNGHCDKCNEHAPFWCMASTYHESNFCPNCGAEMDKGGTE